MRRVRWETDNVIYDIPAIPSSYETCALTHAWVMFRDDDVISIQYTDGKIYTVHKDGTWMFSEADGSMITVEREGYSTVKVWVGVSNTENIEELEVEEKKALDDYIL